MHISKPPPGTPVDWQHPLAQGLIGAWLFNEGAGERLEDATGMGDPANFVGITAADWRSDGPYSPGLLCDASGEWASVPDQLRLRPANAVSVVAGFTLEGDIGNYTHVVFSKGGLSWMMRGDGGTNIGATLNLTGGAITAASIAGAGVGAHIGVVTWQIGDYVRIYLENGRVGISATTGDTPISYNTSAITFGCDFTSRVLVGIVNFVYLYGTQLQPEAVASLMGNPWQMMWDRKKYWYTSGVTLAAARGYLTGGDCMTSARRSLATGGQL